MASWFESNQPPGSGLGVGTLQPPEQPVGGAVRRGAPGGGLGAPGGDFPGGPYMPPSATGNGNSYGPQVQDQWGRSPGDPMYNIAPGTDPNASKGGTPGASGNPTDPNYITQQVVAWAQKNNRPDIASNPQYWVDQIARTGGWDNAGNTGYWSSRMGGTDSTGNEASQGHSGLGGGALGGAAGMLGDFGAFTKPYTGSFSAPTFSAPSGLSLENDPGYQARLKFGTDAIQSSAAAKGTLLTGGTVKDLERYGEDYGSNEYANVYSRALQGSQLGYNQALSGFQQNYDIFRNNQTDPFNKLYQTTSLGLNAAQSAVGAGSTYGNQLGQRASQYATNQS